MNALELADELDIHVSMGGSKYLKEAATMIRILEGQLAFRIDAVTKYQAWVEAQQAEIDKVNAEWVRASTALVNAVNEIRQQQAEIKRLTQENCDLWEHLNGWKAQEKND